MKYEDLGQLIGQIESAVTYYEDGSIEWREIWDAIKHTGSSFNGTRFPSREKREAEWQRFQIAVGNVKQLQSAEFDRKKQFRGNSESHYYRIKNMIDHAMPDNGLGQVFLTLATGGLNLIGKAALDAIFGKLDEELEELKRCSRRLGEAGAYFKEHKHEMLGRHKHGIHEALGHAREKLDKYWDDYKSRRQQAHDSRQMAWQERQREFEERRDRWRSNQEDFLDKLLGSRSRLEEALSHKLENRDKLNDMQSNAKGDDFRSRVDDWVDENEAAIDSIREKISNVEEKITEVRDKLRE
jgi:hypothetical protein